MSNHTEFGCRPSQFLGPFLMEQDAYDAMMDQAAMLIGAGQYEIVARQSAEMAAAKADEPPYTVDNGVALFTISGPMTKYPTSMQAALGGTATLPLQRAVRLAAQDGFVNGGFVDVNSPGGTTEGLADISEAFAMFRAVKPLRMHVSGMGCSAAMRVGIEADALTADPMAITGSIGTLTRMRDTSKLMERAGIKDHYIASGDRKAAGAPGTEVTPEQITERKALIDAINQNFLDAVARRRPLAREHMTDIARAGLYDSKRAVLVGLADAVMTTDEAFRQFASRIPFGSGRTLPG